MAYESIALQGYNTGGVKTPNTIRRGFAFDLTSVDLRDRVVVSATLQLRRTVGSTATSTVQLTNPPINVLMVASRAPPGWAPFGFL